MYAPAIQVINFFSVDVPKDSAFAVPCIVLSQDADVPSFVSKYWFVLDEIGGSSTDVWVTVLPSFFEKLIPPPDRMLLLT